MSFDFQGIELEQTTDNYNIAGILRTEFREHLKARYNMLGDDMLDYLCETHIYMNRPASSSMKKLKLDKVQVLVFDVTPHRPVNGIDGTDQPLTAGDIQTLFEELRACYDGYKFKPTTLYIEIRSTGKMVMRILCTKQYPESGTMTCVASPNMVFLHSPVCSMTVISRKRTTRLISISYRKNLSSIISSATISS